MRKVLAVITLVGLLLGCGGPSPEEQVATEVAIKQAAAATLTARAPTLTPTPTPTFTPTPTPTPTATPTATSTPTFTPTPTATFTPTPVPMVVPSGWAVYDEISGAFRLAYPPKWKIQDEAERSVTFLPSTYATCLVFLTDAICGLGEREEPENVQRCLATEMSNTWSASGYNFRLGGTGPWNDGVFRGYSVQATVTSSDVQTALLYVFVPITGARMAWMTYMRAGTAELSQQEADSVSMMMSTFRLADSNAPLVTATPSVTPTRTNTPKPTATPFTYRLGDWIEAKRFKLRIDRAAPRPAMSYPYECQDPCIAVVYETISTKGDGRGTLHTGINLWIATPHGQTDNCRLIKTQAYRDEYGLAGYPEWAPEGQSLWGLLFCQPGFKHRLGNDPAWRPGPLYLVIEKPYFNDDSADGAIGKRIDLGISLK